MKNEENKKLAGDQSGHITLKVKGKDENEVLFRIKRSTQLKKLMTAYCNRQSFDINCVMFLFNGRYLRTEQTPLELDMEDGDEIDALIYVSHDFNHHNDVGNSTNGVVVGNSSSNYVASSSEFDSNLSHDRLHDSGGNDKQAECCSIHLIDEDGTFNAVGLDNFIKKVKLGECGISYAVVAIMGPQSSGKSTLLNHLFHTNFREMDAYQGRSRTTKGIWIAKGAGIDPCIIVMDLEGTDGRERGEDDTTFEKQSALFALALSDIVLINMWCHDIGLEQAANKPLLKTVFQVMLRLLIPRKTSLVFVIRDKTRTPLEYLEPVLREDIQKIWDSIPKPEAHKYTPLSRFFNVKVVALSSYEDKEEQFKEQVTSLREKFFQSITPDSLAGDRRGVVPASGFSFSAQQIWKVIKENKGLDLPAHKVMVATVLCEEIVHEKYSSFVANKDWLELQEVAQSQRIPAFGKKLSSLLYNCLSSYDEEATYFENSVRSVKRKQLEEKLMQLVEPAYQLMLEHILPETLENFKKALNDALNGGLGFVVAARDCAKEFMRIFDEEYAITQAICDLAKVRDTFSCDLNSHIVEIRTTKLSELASSYESEINKALYGPVESLLEKGSDDTWPAIRNLLHQETAKAVSEFFFALSGFEIGKQEKEDIISNLKIYSRGLVEGKAREEAGKALYHMKERFTSIFKHDDGSMPRVWTGNEDIQATAKTAQYSSINLLSVLAAIRLDEEIDTIRDTLVLTLMDPKIGNSKSTTLQDPLASSTWEEVSATNTLITPVECKSLWNEFQKEIEYIITQAIASQAMACGQGGTNSSKSNTDEHRTHSSDACQGADDSSSFAGYVDQLDDDIFHPDNIQVGESRTPEGTPQGCGANQQRDLPEPLDVRELLLFDEDGSIINDSVVRQCTTILKSCFHGPWCYWKDVPEDQRRIMFDRFRGHYRWDPSHEQLVYGRWGSIMGRRYHDFLRDARERAWRLAKQKEGPSVVGDFKKIIPFPPPYIPHKFWREMIESTWDTDKWKAKAKAAKENRNKEYGGASSRHNGGSISFVQHKRRMTKENGFEPTPAELFVRTHTKRRVGEASSSDPVFPYPRAEQALKTYKQGMCKKYGNTDPSSIPVHDPQVWEESVGGRKKGRLFGFVTNARASSIGTSYIPRPPPDVASLEEKIKIVEAQNAEVLARERAREAEVEKLRKQMEEDRKKMEEDRKKWEHEFEQRMQNILKQRSGSESTAPPPHPPPI